MHSSWYGPRKYTIGLDLEKISGAGFTRMSTKAGDLLTINFRECDALNVADSVPNRVCCALNYDCVLNMQSEGIRMLDLFNHQPNHNPMKLKQEIICLINI